MQSISQLQHFWNYKIRSRFDQLALNYQVALKDGSRVRYSNLDNAATTSPFLKVTKELQKELQEYGSVHRGAGRKSKISTLKYEEARDTVLRFVNASDSHYVVFTANTTSSINQLAYFFARIKGKIMVSDIEHSSSWLPWVLQEGWHHTVDQVTLEEMFAAQTTELNSRVLQLGHKHVITYRTKRDFTIDIGDVEKLLHSHNTSGCNEKVKALVITGASNVTGYKPPLSKLARLAHRYGAMIVIDGCQLLQHQRIDMTAQEIDFIVFSGHKMYAPFGSGVIVGDKRVLNAFWPYQIGGGNFPYITRDGKVLRFLGSAEHEPGTPNYVGARALHHAIKEINDIDIDQIAMYEHALVKHVCGQLEAIPTVQLTVPHIFERNLVTFNIESIPPRLVAEILDWEYGIGTRAGTYCAYEFSRRVTGITAEEDAHIALDVIEGITASIPGSVRASFCMYNNFEDVERFVLAITEIATLGGKYYKTKYWMDKRTGEWFPYEGTYVRC